MKQADIGARIALLTAADPDVALLFDEIAGELEGELASSTTLQKEQRMISSIARPIGGPRQRATAHDPSIKLMNQPHTRPKGDSSDAKLVTGFDAASADRVYARRAADAAARGSD